VCTPRSPRSTSTGLPGSSGRGPACQPDTRGRGGPPVGPRPARAKAAGGRPSLRHYPSTRTGPRGSPMCFRRQSMLLVLLTVCLRLPAVLHPKYIDDEGGYAVVAHELAGRHPLYQCLGSEATAPFLDLYSHFFCRWPL